LKIIERETEAEEKSTADEEAERVEVEKSAFQRGAYRHAKKMRRASYERVGLRWRERICADLRDARSSELC
jgi:hypothetical protein